MKLKTCAHILLLFCLVATHSAYANTKVLNSIDAGEQINPGIASLPNNRFVMVYEDRSGADGSSSGIFGGIYDAQNQLIHDCGVMNTTANSFQTFPHVAAAPDGSFMVVWSNFTNTFGQRFSSTCEKLGDETFLGATFNGLDVSADADGNFWVVRSKDGKAYARKYSNTGALLINDVLLVEYVLPEKPVRVVSAVLATGELLVSWYNKDNADSSDIYGLYVNTDGTVTSEPFVINATTVNNQIKPMTAPLSGGGFVAVWASDDEDGISEIVGRVFGSDGVAGDEFFVSEVNGADQSTPYVIGRVGGGFSVGWTDESNPQHVYLASYDVNSLLVGQRRAVSVDETLTLTGNAEIELTELTNGSLASVWTATTSGNQDIYGRVLAPSLPVFGEPSSISKLNSIDAGEQINPGIASLPNNRFVMVYEDRSGADGSSSGIFGGIYDAQNQLIHDCGVMNTTANSFQTFPHVAAAPDGSFMVVWSNFTNTFGQRFSSTCEKLGDETFLGATFNGLDVSADADGNFWVVRSKDGKAYARKYSNTGALLINDVLLVEYVLPEKPVRVVSAVLATGELLVSWYNKDNADSSDIYGLYVNTDGTVTSEPFVINATTVNNQIKPMTAPLSGGGFVAVWASDDEDGISEIVGRVFGSDGVAGDEFFVSEVNGADQSTPYVIGRVGGGFSVGWTDESNPQHVYLASYDVNSLLVGQRRAVSVDETLTLTGNAEIELTELTNGSLAAVWSATASGNQDVFGITLSALAPAPEDSDGDGIPDNEDAFPLDASEDTDTDGDGIGNNADSDDDNDGVADTDDDFPSDPDETLDTDSDGVGNNADSDDDGDGIADVDDVYPLDPLGSWTDTDGNGAPDDGVIEYRELEYSPDCGDIVCLPSPDDPRAVFVATGCVASDNASGFIICPDELTLPDTFDGEPVVQIAEGAFSVQGLTSLQLNSNVDSIPRNAFSGNSLQRVEIPQSVIRIEAQAFAANEFTEVIVGRRVDFVGSFAFFNNPRIVNGLGEGLPAAKVTRLHFYGDYPTLQVDAFYFEVADDAVVSYCSNKTGWEGVEFQIAGRGVPLIADCDKDGVTDAEDAFPFNGSESLDTDGDGAGDNEDIDDDGDGVEDSSDAFPLDASESIDTDGDGVGNNVDTDDDGDQVNDSIDAFPLDTNESVDTDSDGIGNNADTDDDGDGYSDSDELTEGTDPLDHRSYPEVPGLPVWLLYISTQQ